MLMLKCRNKNSAPRALILGVNRDDANRLLRGEEVDRQYAGSPIPDDVWPPDEHRNITIATIEDGGLPRDAADFDLVAIACAAAESDAIVAMAVRRLRPGGKIWVEPVARCIDCGATEGNSFTHDNGKTYHLGCPGAPGGGSLGRIDSAPTC